MKVLINLLIQKIIRFLSSLKVKFEEMNVALAKFANALDLEKVFRKFNLGINKLSVQLQKNNPFASDKMVKDAQKRFNQIKKIYEENPIASEQMVLDAERKLDRVKKLHQETADNQVATFSEARNKVLSEDQSLHKARMQAVKKLDGIYKETNATLEETVNKTILIKTAEEQKEEVIQRIEKNYDINTKLQRQIERINALKQGGESLLLQVEKRHKAEDDIRKLMADSNLRKR